ncbi:MAG: ribosome maturation factor RimP [Micavibrio sp.]|nr:ribosome maturation factor RimP [Micavibrio sp.]|tara:strand:+ start:761 stop:1306 length:546 start_codon:yes stop_codon:yes gene_type:complete
MAKTLIDPEGRFYDLINPVIEDMGCRLVRVRLTSSDRDGQIVEIMIEAGEETTDFNLDKCASVNRSLSAVFEVEDPISGAYRLEVGSPGIDRPLTRLEDFALYKDMVAKIELHDPIETGQKRFRGVIKGVDKELVKLRTDEGDYELPFKEFKKAGLVMTDELMEASKNGQFNKTKKSETKE